MMRTHPWIAIALVAMLFLQESIRPLTSAVTSAETVLPTPSNEASDNPRWSGSPADSPLPILEKRRPPPSASGSSATKIPPRNNHRAGSWSSCADDMAAALDLPLHTCSRSPKGPWMPTTPVVHRSALANFGDCFRPGSFYENRQSVDHQFGGISPRGDCSKRLLCKSLTVLPPNSIFSRSELITDLINRQKMAWVGWIGFELLSKIENQIVNSPCRQILRPPDSS